MLEQVRNDGSRGIASMAISALDIALWDLKAKPDKFRTCRRNSVTVHPTELSDGLMIRIQPP